MMKNGLIVEHNVKRWYKDGKLHREDGPAVELTDGYKGWYKDNQYHREDGPAIEWPSGVKSWWFNGTQLSTGNRGFWMLWDRLTDKQRGNPNLLRYMPR